MDKNPMRMEPRVSEVPLLNGKELHEDARRLTNGNNRLILHNLVPYKDGLIKCNGYALWHYILAPAWDEYLKAHVAYWRRRKRQYIPSFWFDIARDLLEDPEKWLRFSRQTKEGMARDAMLAAGPPKKSIQNWEDYMWPHGAYEAMEGKYPDIDPVVNVDQSDYVEETYSLDAIRAANSRSITFKSKTEDTYLSADTKLLVDALRHDCLTVTFKFPPERGLFTFKTVGKHVYQMPMWLDGCSETTILYPMG